MNSRQLLWINDSTCVWLFVIFNLCLKAAISVLFWRATAAIKQQTKQKKKRERTNSKRTFRKQLEFCAYVSSNSVRCVNTKTRMATSNQRKYATLLLFFILLLHSLYFQCNRRVSQLISIHFKWILCCEIQTNNRKKMSCLRQLQWIGEWKMQIIKIWN